MFGTIGQIASSITSLATSYIDGKAQVQKVNAEIKKKQLTGELDLDLMAVSKQDSSYKDEFVTLVFVAPFILCFCGDWGRTIVSEGFQAIQQAPDWYKWIVSGVVASAIGMRGVSKFLVKK